MLLATITGSASATVKVERYASGVEINTLKKTATIKIDRRSEKNGDVNILPLMTIDDAVQLFGSFLPTTVINENSTNQRFEKIVIPFTLDGGAIPLDDTMYYEISFGTISGETFTVNSRDAFKVGNPLHVQRGVISASATEKNEDVSKFLTLYFPNEIPTLIEASTFEFGKQRKVSIDQKQITNNDNLGITVFDTVAETYTQGFAKPSYAVVGQNQVILHKASASELVFYKVGITVIKPNAKR